MFGYTVFAGLYFALQNLLHYIAVLVITYIISITNSYLGHKIFVFKTTGNYAKEYLRYYQVTGISFLMNLLLLPFFVEVFEISIIISQGLVVFFVAAISYIGHKYYSFNV